MAAPAPPTRVLPAEHPSAVGSPRQQLAAFEHRSQPRLPPASPSPPPGPPPPDQAVVLDASLGAGSEGVQIGAAALYFNHWFEVGGAVTPRTTFFENSVISAFLAGVKIDLERHVRFDLLAEFGAQEFNELGSGLLVRPLQSYSLTLPYLGGRIGLSWLAGRSTAFVLGAWLQVGDDLGRRKVVVPVETCFLGCTTSNEPITVGESSLSLSLRVGGQIFIR